MQMRAGHASGGAHFADARNGRYLVSDGNFDHAQMRVERKKASPVVEDNGIAREKIISDIDDCRRTGSHDRRAFECRNVHAVVGIARLAIEEATLSISIGT